MKKLFSICALVLISILVLGSFLSCDMFDTPMRGIYFTIDPTDFNDEYDYYFAGYNTDTGGDYFSIHTEMEIISPGVFFTYELLNLGDWVWSVYEVSKDYPKFFIEYSEEIADKYDSLIAAKKKSLAQGKELPQAHGLHRCQIDIRIKLTKDGKAEHTVVLKDKDEVLTATVTITGSPERGETLHADMSKVDYELPQYQWLVSDAEEGEYQVLTDYTEATLKLDEQFFAKATNVDILGDAVETVYVKFKARSIKGDMEVWSDSVSVSNSD